MTPRTDWDLLLTRALKILGIVGLLVVIASVFTSAF